MRAVLFALALTLAACERSGAPARPNKKVWTQEEFRTPLEGKAAEEVIAIVSHPDGSRTANTSVYWYYRGSTRDAATGKVDASTQVVFRDGRVVNFNF